LQAYTPKNLSPGFDFRFLLKLLKTNFLALCSWQINYVGQMNRRVYFNYFIINFRIQPEIGANALSSPRKRGAAVLPVDALPIYGTSVA
jgi:hypothetical protein